MDIFHFIWPEFPEIKGVDIGLARSTDAKSIGQLSKKLIETGLPNWAWNPTRVAAQIHNPKALVLTGKTQSKIVAFAIMQFGKETANLSLLGVEEDYQRSGTGSCLVRFLENSAFLMGNTLVMLELRSKNIDARVFYESLGYREVEELPSYYSNKETAIRMSRKLRIKPSVEYSWGH